MSKKCVRLSFKARERMMLDFQHSLVKVERVKEKLLDSVKGGGLTSEQIFNCWLDLCDVCTDLSVLCQRKLIKE